MQPLDDDFARRVRRLTEVLVRKLNDQWIENEKFNRSLDLDQYRKDLAESNPELSRYLEQMVIDDREEVIKQLTMAEAVAYAVVWAMDNFSEHL